MSGNIWEWVWDRRGDYSSGSQTDPTGPDSVPDRVPYRVFRGGCWSYSARRTRVSRRYYDGPARRYGILGFRLSRLIPSRPVEGRARRAFTLPQRSYFRSYHTGERARSRADDRVMPENSLRMG